MQINTRCQRCGNTHIGNCSHEILYFNYYPHQQQSPKSVFLVGEWYRWQNHQPMDAQYDESGKLYYSIGSNVPLGRFEYKFIVDGKWEYSRHPEALISPDAYGSFNNYVEVLPKKALLEYIPSQDIKLTSSLAIKDLCIMGSWDNWSSLSKMELVYNSLKDCEENFIYLELIPNTTYEFKFYANSQYYVDEKYPTVFNELGSLNNRIFICSEKMNTPTGWRLNKSLSNIMINCRSFEWQRIQVQGNSCEYKHTLDGHSMCQVGEYIYIFGGRIHNDFTNKLTKINIHKLSVMQSEQLMPSQRAFHGAAAYGNKMIVFGGHNKVILQDYIIFNTTDKTWWLSPEIKGNFPSKRQKQSCVLFQTLLVFFGGYYCKPDFEFQYTYNDIQVLDIQDMKWIDQTRLKVQGNLPSPRFSHAAAVIHSQMFIFGGKNVYNEKGKSCHVYFNDLWSMNLQKTETLQWEQITPKGQPPAPRHGHTMTPLNNFLVIFGGEGAKKQKYNDVIVFNTEQKQWIYPIIKCKTHSCRPLPRVYHGATGVNNQFIVIFGGKNVNQKSTSFYILRPKDLKMDLDIEEQDESEGTQMEGRSSENRGSDKEKDVKKMEIKEANQTISQMISQMKID